MKRLQRLLVVIGISVLISFGATPASFADRECAIDSSGNPVEICISNTISGGSGSSGGGSLIYGIRPMSAFLI